MLLLQHLMCRLLIDNLRHGFLKWRGTAIAQRQHEEMVAAKKERRFLTKYAKKIQRWFRQKLFRMALRKAMRRFIVRIRRRLLRGLYWSSHVLGRFAVTCILALDRVTREDVQIHCSTAALSFPFGLHLLSILPSLLPGDRCDRLCLSLRVQRRTKNELRLKRLDEKRIRDMKLKRLRKRVEERMARIIQKAWKALKKDKARMRLFKTRRRQLKKATPIFKRIRVKWCIVRFVRRWKRKVHVIKSMAFRTY